MSRFPISFIVLTALGVLTGIPGAISLAGAGAALHPVLEDPMAGLAFMVSDTAAPVVLASTHEAVLRMVPLTALQEHDVDVPQDPGSLGP